MDRPSADPSPKASRNIAARYEVASTTWGTPAAAARANWWHRNGTPAVGSSGLGADSVSGRSLVPCPPTSRIASSGSRGMDLVAPTVFGCRLAGRFRVRSGVWVRAFQAIHVFGPFRAVQASPRLHGALLLRAALDGAPVTGEVGLGRRRPGELLGPGVPGQGQCLPAGRILQQRPQRRLDAVGV